MSALITGRCRPGIILYVALVVIAARSTHSAPIESNSTQVAEYDGAGGCYYNFQHYQEGARIVTNEPCLNCTCHNRMLMCYLRVCPFTKAIGQDCTVEKRPDQCCPIITCPEVPVQLLTSTTSSPSSKSTDLAAPGSTELGFPDTYGCNVEERFYADGAQLPVDSNNPCELCYCIRNKTTCLMQQCTLSVAGCRPVYQPGICCPVKYNCDYDEVHEAAIGTTPGLVMTTTVAPHPAAPPKCHYEDRLYEDGELIYTIQPCQHCYCFHGEIVCAVQECGKPMESHKKNCTALPPLDGECCPTTYLCEDDLGNIATEIPEADKKTQESTEPSETFPGADNAIPENLTTEKTQTVSPIGNEVPESEPTKSTFTEKATDISTTPLPEGVKSVEEIDDQDESAEVTTQNSEEISKTTETLPKEHSSESPAINEDDSFKPEITTILSEVEQTTPINVRKGEQELTNAIATEKSSEESTKSSAADNAIESKEPGIMQTELPVESTTILIQEAEKSSESSSPVSDTEKHIDSAQTADLTTEIPSEEIKNKQTKESDVEPSFDSTTVVSDYDESNKSTLAPSISENAISSEENKSEEKDASISESSTPIPTDNSATEGIDTAIVPEISPAENENKEDDKPSLDNSTEKPEDVDTLSGTVTTSPSPDEDIKSDETISPEISTAKDIIVESSTMGSIETEAAESSETDHIHPTAPSTSQESSAEENITPSSTPSEDAESEKSNIEESATEESGIPPRGPSGIPIPSRVPEHKAEDKDAVTDNEVTEGYLVTGSGIPQNIDNLQTDQPQSGPTTYLPPADSKTEDHQSSTPLYEEPSKELHETTETSITSEISSDAKESVKENSEESKDSSESATDISEKEKSDSEVPEGTSELPTMKETDSSIVSVDKSETASDEEKTKLEPESTTSEIPEKTESTTESLIPGNYPVASATDKSDENKIDESSKEIPADNSDSNLPEESTMDKNQSMDESFTTISSDITSKKSQESDIIPTPSEEITEIPAAAAEPSTDASNEKEFDTKISEVSTESSTSSSETGSDKKADDEEKENKMPSDATVNSEIHEISTPSFISESTTEVGPIETKLNDQEEEKSDIGESQLPDEISTTSSSQLPASDDLNEGEIKKEEELSPSTEADEISSQTPEVEITLPESRPSHGIPGEGNCLVDGQSYTNNSAIPPANSCQISCQCVSSIVQCELVQCSAPPADLLNCVPMYSDPAACCPMYTCDSTPTVELQAGNQMSGGESPTTEKSEEVVEPEKTMTESTESSAKQDTESATLEPEKIMPPASPAEGEMVSPSSTESSLEMTSESEVAEKSGEDQPSSSIDEKNETDQQGIDLTTEPTQKTPEEPLEESKENIPSDDLPVTPENSKSEGDLEIEAVTTSTEKALSSTDSISEEQPAESTESNIQESSSIEPNPEINHTDKPDENEKLIPETTVISIEPVESDIQKATSESTILSSTEKSESSTEEALKESEPSDSEEPMFPTDSHKENPSTESIIESEEPTTTASIALDQHVFEPEKTESAEPAATEKTTEDELNKSQDLTTESQKTGEIETSSENELISSTESSAPALENSTDAVEEPEQGSSPSTIPKKEESNNESSEAAPTTALPVAEIDITTLPTFSESVSEEVQSSSEVPSSGDEKIEIQSPEEKPQDETSVKIESATEKEIEPEISTEKSDELPKEDLSETSKESNKESSSTTPKLDKAELSPTEQPAEIEEGTQKVEIQESTDTNEDKVSNEPEKVENSESNLETNATEEPKLGESTTAIGEELADKEADGPKETQDENSEEKLESTSPGKIDEEPTSQEFSTTPEPIKAEEPSSETPSESSSEVSSDSERYPSTEGTILEGSSTSSEKSAEEELTTPSSASEKPEIDNSVPQEIPEESSKAPEVDEPASSESPDASINEEGHYQPTDESIPTDDEHRPIDASTVQPETSRPHTRPPYPDQMVPETDDPNIFPPDSADIKNQYQPDDVEGEDYDDQAVYGPGTCRYGGKIYMSAQQIPRDDACDFCFCFRSDIICLQQSCPPPIPGCHEEPIGGFCCPRYECPVSMATSLNVTTTTTTTTTTVPPHFLSHAYKGSAIRGGCQVGNKSYHIGEEIKSKSGPCMRCLCGGDGKMKCEPLPCSASPTLKEMIAHAAAKKRRR